MSSKETRLVGVGRSPEANHGVVNPPVYHASTIVYPTLAALEEADRTPYQGTRYGRRGTPTTFALEEAVAELEGGYRSIAVPSGLAAITTSLLAFLKSGDHLLMVDTTYAPTRSFCDTVLAGLGIATSYYDPLADIAPLLRPETRVVFTESPGSLTYEVQDIPRLAAAARAAGAVVMLDNTWSAGLLFAPFAHGVDVSIQAATKYIVGHSDVMQGIVITDGPALSKKISTAYEALGLTIGADDAYLALRGLRTLPVRLAQHQRHATEVAQWLEQQPQVGRV
ncbi:MAG: PLP-dependent transferase, partial [Proteobacteria bacterium]|nr:PLP-dependent transferase [Pseudomonadota bacterium]